MLSKFCNLSINVPQPGENWPMHQKRIAKFTLTKVSVLALSSTMIGGTAPAQSGYSFSPHYVDIDENGVALASGSFFYAIPPVRLGNDQIGLTLQDHFEESGRSAVTWKDNFTGRAIHTTGAGLDGIISVEFSGSSLVFQNVSGSWINTRKEGADIVVAPNQDYYLLHRKDGTEVRFDKNLNYGNQQISLCTTNLATTCSYYPTQVVFADGRSQAISYDVNSICFSASACTYYVRLGKVNTNYGYEAVYYYGTNSLSINDIVAWSNKTSVELRSSSNTNNKIVIQYSYPSSLTSSITLPGGQTWTFNQTSFSDSEGVQYRPVSSILTPDQGSINVDYDQNETTTGVYVGTSGVTDNPFYGSVRSVTKRGLLTSYSYQISSTSHILSFSDASGRHGTVTSDIGTLETRPTAITDSYGKTTHYSYDSYARLTGVEYPEGNHDQYVYDDRGNVIAVTKYPKTGMSGSPQSTQVGFPQNCTNYIVCSRPTYVIDPRLNRTDYAYDDGTGQLSYVIRAAPVAGADRAKISFDYIKQGGVSLLKSVRRCQTSSTCSGTNDEIVASYDYDQNLFVAQEHLGNSGITATTARTYDWAGNVISLDGPVPGSADLVTYRYNAARQVVGEIDPDPDGAGQLQQRAIRNSYDSGGRLVMSEVGKVAGTSEAAWGNFTPTWRQLFGFDEHGNKISEVTAAGATTFGVLQYGYDIAGRLECTSRRMNPSAYSSILSTSACNLGPSDGQVQDRIGRVEYDLNGRTLKLWQAYGTDAPVVKAIKSYTQNGKLRTLTDGNGNTTTYEYDSFDRPIKTFFPGIGGGASSSTDYEQVGYDDNGNVISRRLRDGSSISLAFDGLNRVTSITEPSYGNSASRSYFYDNLDQVLHISASNSSFVNDIYYNYDALGFKRWEYNFYNGVGRISYSDFDLAGHRTRLQWDDGYYVTYSYDPAGHVKEVRERGDGVQGAQLASFDYDDLGRIKVITMGNGKTAGFAYDDISRVNYLQPIISGAGRVGIGLSYNPAGQVTKRIVDNDVYAWTQHYNVVRPYAVNGLNQYPSAGSATMSYDGRGNLIASGSDTFTYSADNELTGAVSARFDYDGLHRLLFSSASSTWFDYDGNDLIAEYDAAGNMRRRYIFGMQGTSPFLWLEGAGLNDKRWMHADERGSVVAVSDSSGSIIAQNSYDEFGIPQTSNIGRFQFTGQKWLPEIRLYDFGARTYSPTLGRFLQTDPIGYGDEINLYAYSRNDPVNLVDPTGKIIQASDPNQQARIQDLINKNSREQYKFDSNNNLVKVAGVNKAGSEYYSRRLDQAIKNNQVIKIEVASSYTDLRGTKIDIDRDAGGGNSNWRIFSENVTVSGNSYNKLRDVSGKQLRDRPEDILMHELLGHAIPRVVGRDTGNAVENENKGRAEIPGAGQRAWESHPEGW